MIDPNIVNYVIDKFFKQGVDYATNILKRTYPHGMDTEVFTFSSLERAYSEAKEAYEREHVTPYIRLHPEKFSLLNIEAPSKFYAPDIRVTLDTEEDYALLCAVYDYLYYKDPIFSTEDIIDLFKLKPWLRLINKKVVQKKIFNSLEEEIEEAIKVLELQDLNRVVKYLKRKL